MSKCEECGDVVYARTELEALVAQEVAKERDRCAKINNDRADRLAKYPSYFEIVEYLRECAEEIRQT